MRRPAPDTAEPAPLAAEPISITSHPLPAAILVLALAAALGSTFLMRRMADQLVGGSGIACPHKDA